MDQGNEWWKKFLTIFQWDYPIKIDWNFNLEIFYTCCWKMMKITRGNVLGKFLHTSFDTNELILSSFLENVLFELFYDINIYQKWFTCYLNPGICSWNFYQLFCVCCKLKILLKSCENVVWKISHSKITRMQ